MRGRLWLIGGTQESRALVAALQLRTFARQGPASVLVSVTTAAAQDLYPRGAWLTVWVGRLTAANADHFIKQQAIQGILDASHPFATEISRRAIALAQQHGLPYLRYERPALTPAELDWLDKAGRPGNVVLSHFQEIFAGNYLVGERTLLTLGYRLLPQFAPWQPQGILFARILPSPSALSTALAAGFTPDRLIALRPPISPDLETALWRQWQITQVITKASGQAGGEDRKQAIAADLGVRLIRLARPTLTYPAQTTCLQTALAFAHKVIGAAPANTQQNFRLSHPGLREESKPEDSEQH